MRVILFFVALITVFIACEKEPILDIRDGMSFNPDTIMIDSSMKGWELYTWHSGETWRYSLMGGTNRIKHANEIISNPYAVDGREQLKLLIRRLPSGEEIIWLGPEWVISNIDDPAGFLDTIPPLLTQYDISEFCELQGVDLAIVP